MKRAILSITLVASILASCGNNNMKTADQNSQSATENSNTSTTTKVGNPLVSNYLAIKSALVKDDGNTASEAGKSLAEVLKVYDPSTLTEAQQKTFKDIKSDAIENAEHIGENPDKIEHQREHFFMLSQDMYDFVKSVDTKTTLYKTFCPMANDKKGAFWLSTTKEIQNPYMGQKMDKCGSVEETIN